MSTRLRILCLHGFTSNGQVHAFQIRNITKALPEYEFLFPSGPHEVDIASQMDMTTTANKEWADIVSGLSDLGHRAWWYAKDGDRSKPGAFYGLEKSLDFLGDYLGHHGPVHAICGFSQGACFAGMLNALLQDKLRNHPLRKHLPSDTPTPMAGVIFSGFRARFPQYDDLYEPGIDVPLLHVLGEKDPLVQSDRSRAFIDVCHNSKVLIHAGGHDIPKAADHQRQIVDFLRHHVATVNAQSDSASL